MAVTVNPSSIKDFLTATVIGNREFVADTYAKLSNTDKEALARLGRSRQYAIEPIRLDVADHTNNYKPNASF